MFIKTSGDDSIDKLSNAFYKNYTCNNNKNIGLRVSILQYYSKLNKVNCSYKLCLINCLL